MRHMMSAGKYVTHGVYVVEKLHARWMNWTISYTLARAFIHTGRYKSIISTREQLYNDKFYTFWKSVKILLKKWQSVVRHKHCTIKSMDKLMNFAGMLS